MNINTDQAFVRLKEAGVTDSIQTVRRWLREGKIKAERSENRKAGFEIDNSDLQRFINERTGADKDNRINFLNNYVKTLEKDNKRFDKENIKFVKENAELKKELDVLKKENPMLEAKDDFTRRLERINKKLHPQFKSLEYRLPLDICDWLSEFEMEKQERITDIEFNTKIINKLRESDASYWIMIMNTPITGNQINRHINLTSTMEYKLLIVVDDFSKKLKEAKTTDEIDSLLDQLEQSIMDKQRENFQSKSSFNFDDMFGTFTKTSTINYREKLGLSSTSTNDEVKKEFKKLLKILHPDTGGDAKLFQHFKQEYDDFRKSI